MDQTFNIAAAAKYLGIGKRTLDRLRAMGKGPRFAVVGARRVVYRKSELDAYLDSRTVSNSTAGRLIDSPTFGRKRSHAATAR